MSPTEASTSTEMSASGAQASAFDIEREALSTQFAELLHPVAVGSTLGGATVQAIRVDEWGTGEVRLSSPAGSFRVDVHAKDPETAYAPMATTGEYALFVRNGGTGSKKTAETVAAAVASLAETLRSNETSSAPVALVTKAEYWSADFWQRS